MDKTFFYYLAGVPLLGVIAQWLAWRFRLPSILLLLAFGVALGQFIDVDKVIYDVSLVDAGSFTRPPDDAPRIVASQFLFPIISLSVAVILFEGGLTLRLNELKHAGTAVFRMVTFAVAITWVLTAFAAA